MYKSRDEILEAEHKLLQKVVNMISKQLVDAENACSFFSGVVSMTDALFAKEGDD